MISILNNLDETKRYEYLKEFQISKMKSILSNLSDHRSEESKNKTRLIYFKIRNETLSFIFELVDYVHTRDD